MLIRAAQLLKLCPFTDHLLVQKLSTIAGFILAGALWPLCLSGCTTLHSAHLPSNHAFIVYWRPPANNQRLTLAVKDLIDIKGFVTSAGSEIVAKNHPPASSDAECLRIARTRNVLIVGKANLSEFAVSPSGINEYFHTPRNPLNKLRRLIPGGSSSGSAVAVATGMADVAFGTDTAGSVRVPAACCGVVGLKTTFGLVPLKGVFPLEPKHLDTVGPMGKDVAHVVQGMDLLQSGFAERYRDAVAANPSAQKIKIGRLYLSGTHANIDKAVDDALRRAQFQVIALGDDFKAKWEQAKRDGDTVAAAGAWISDRQFLDKSEVSGRAKEVIALGGFEYATNYQSALARQGEWQKAFRNVFKKVDFIALPTLQEGPPAIPLPFFGRVAILESRVLGLQNTAAMNFAGNPALAMPIPMRHGSVPVTSLQTEYSRFQNCHSSKRKGNRWRSLLKRWQCDEINPLEDVTESFLPCLARALLVARRAFKLFSREQYFGSAAHFQRICPETVDH